MKKGLWRKKRKQIKANIFEEEKNTKKNNQIRKKKENEWRTENEDWRRREKEGNDEPMLNLLDGQVVWHYWSELR